MNRTVCAMLAMFVSDNQRNWDVFLAKVVFAYNTSKHQTTGVTPFQLFHGRSARLPLDVACGAEHCPADAVCSASELDEIRERVVESIKRAAASRAERHESVSNQIQYVEGDFVWLHRGVRRKGLSPKLQRPWTGPYQVVEVLSPQTYRVRLAAPGRRTSMVVHHDRIKPCVVREEEAYNEDAPDAQCRDPSPHPGNGEESGAAECLDDPADDAVVWSYVAEPEPRDTLAPSVPRETDSDAVARSDRSLSVSGGAGLDGEVIGSREEGTDVGSPRLDGGVVGDPHPPSASDGEREDTSRDSVRRSGRTRRPPDMFGEWTV